MFERLILGAPQWVVPALAGAAVLIGLVGYSYFRTRRGGIVRMVAMTVKVIAILIAVVCLVDPLWSGRRPRPQANVIPLLVDNSRSMTARVPGQRAQRDDQLRETLADNTAWRTRLGQDFDVRMYGFDGQLRGIETPEDLDFAGRSSALHMALQSLTTRLAGRPVAGVVLFSDGNATDLAEANVDWRSLGVPVYPVVPGQREDVRDLQIAGVTVSQSDFETTPVTLDVQLAAQGMSAEPLTVQLLDTEGNVVETQETATAEGEESAAVRFRFRPQQLGPQFYQVRTFPTAKAAAYAALEEEEDGATVDEVTVANNRRWVNVHRRRGPYRVLYVSGRPNWEFKFLRRSIQEDLEVDLVGLIRVAREAPKFAFQDRAVDSTNPLFSGFSTDEEDAAEQQDQPVLLRVGVEDANELAAGFPTAAEELFGYDAVILDDIEPSFFTQDQLLLLRRFIADRGGGLLLLGGPDLFERGAYQESALGELSPVYAAQETARSAGGNDSTGDLFRLALTREGWLQPWLRLRANEDAERQRLEEMPTFGTLSPVDRVKAGASIVATVADPRQGERPALVTQRFGSGRTAALLVGDMWKWAMRREPNQQPDLGQAWRQCVRWLTSDVPRRVETRVVPGATPNVPLQIEVTVRDTEYRPLDNAQVKLQITPPSGGTIVLATTASPDSAGIYRASYLASDNGGYRITADVTAADGSEVGRGEAGWAAAPEADEFRHLGTNRPLLEQIAAATGGELIEEDTLSGFVAELPTRAAPVTEQWVYPVWHRPWVLTVAALCLCTEWGLRRWKGLP